MPKLETYFYNHLKTLLELNVYIKAIHRKETIDFSFDNITSHCSGYLQRMLLGEG